MMRELTRVAALIVKVTSEAGVVSTRVTTLPLTVTLPKDETEF